MSSTLTLTCSVCGLRFTSRPLLELHIREDHLQRHHHAAPDRGDPAGARTSQPRAGSVARRDGQPSGPPRTTNEVITMTATRPQRRLRAGWAMTALRRMIRTPRLVNAELLLASEAIFRPAGAPRDRSRADVPAGTHVHAATARERAERAA